MNITLIADWLPTFGGAEHVIAEFHRLWPRAPIHTTVARFGSLGPLDDADIHVSSLQRWYRLIGDHKLLLPWMPRAMERIDLGDADVVLSSSHAVGKGIIPPPHARHICYCHTPMRYAWEMEDEYLHDFGIPSFLHGFMKRKLAALRRWDMTTAKRVDVFIANSTTVQERIARVYGRQSIVIPPPVDDRFFHTDLPYAPGSYYLAIGRLVPYKRFDLLIEVANAMQLPLKIAGTGDDLARLRRLAGSTVEFLGFVSDADLSSLYANARALLFPPLEDAGVVPLEAQACGTPVIALGAGGALDTVRDKETGLFFAEQTVESVQDAIACFESMTFDRRTIREHAQQFSAGTFREKIASVV